MTQHHSDNPSEGDWEEREDLGWNEFDWQRYLQSSAREVDSFIACYVKHLGQPEAIDAVARELGWDREDWSSEDGEDDPEDEGPSEVYTAHRHPVYLFTRGLFKLLRDSWQADSARLLPRLGAAQAWAWADALQRAESEALLGVQSLDLGDYALAICHFKESLSGLNRALAATATWPLDERGASGFQEFSRARLFDLREVWLRVMRDCREEIARQGRNSGTE